MLGRKKVVRAPQATARYCPAIVAGGSAAAAALAIALVLCAGASAQQQQEQQQPPQPLRSNVFNDPFVQATSGLAGCPAPEPPGVTEQEARELAHDRAQRGVSCWLDGRCRLPNAYLYDAEIAPRVRQALQVAGRFDDTSIWATSQRRRVTLQGCVSNAQQAADAESLVRRIDDVEDVLDQLMVGTAGEPPYLVRQVAPR